MIPTPLKDRIETLAYRIQVARDNNQPCDASGTDPADLRAVVALAEGQRGGVIDKGLIARVERMLEDMTKPGVAFYTTGSEIADLRALLAAQGQEWRPIAEAPRDGTWIIVSQWNTEEARFTRMFWATRAQWTEKWSTPRWWDGIEPSGLVPPTHWMPIIPPQAEGEG